MFHWKSARITICLQAGSSGISVTAIDETKVLCGFPIQTEKHLPDDFQSVMSLNG